jgi:hypothetical protein
MAAPAPPAAAPPSLDAALAELLGADSPQRQLGVAARLAVRGPTALPSAALRQAGGALLARGGGGGGASAAPALVLL